MLKDNLGKVILFYLPPLILGAGMLLGTWPYMAGILICYIFLSLLILKFDWAIFIMLAVIPIVRFPGAGAYVQPIKYIISFAILFVWAIKKMITEENSKWENIKNNPFNPFIVSFLLLIPITTLHSVNTKLSFEFALSYIISFCTLYVLLDRLCGEIYIKKAVIALLFAAFLVACIAIFQYIVVCFGIFSNIGRFILPPLHRNILYQGKPPFFTHALYRSVGTFYHFNHLGIYLAMVMPIAISLLFFVKDRIKHIGLLIVIVFIGVAIFCSGSRGAFLNLFISTSFLGIVYRDRIPKKAILFILLCVASGYLFFSPVIKLYFRMAEGLSYRDIIWKNSLEMIKERPFLGFGLGTFPQVFLSRYTFPSMVDFEDALGEIEITGTSEVLGGFNAHNQFLNYAAEMGVFAVLLIFIFYITFARTVCMLFRHRHPNFNYALLAASSASVFGCFVHGFFEAYVTFYPLSIGTLFVFIVSLAVISANNLRSDGIAH